MNKRLLASIEYYSLISSDKVLFGIWKLVTGVIEQIIFNKRFVRE